jgi:opacity protein-like surface antigen
MRRLLVAAGAAWLTSVSMAQAQTDPDGALRRGAFEVGVDGVWQAGLPAGTARATLTGNQQGTPAVTFFNTSSEFVPAAGVEARLAWHFSRVFAVEGTFGYARPRLETSISDDIEQATATVATQDISQYVIFVNGVAHLRRLGRVAPFVFGGAGYLRELYSGRQVVETGQIYQAGGGVKIMFSEARRGLIKGLGVRADGRLRMRRGGVELDAEEPVRSYGAAAAGLIVVF